MNILKHLTIVALAVLFSLGSAAAGIENKDKGKIVPEMNIKEVKIIRVNAIAGVNPGELTIDRGTTVIWINEAESSLKCSLKASRSPWPAKSRPFCRR